VRRGPGFPLWHLLLVLLVSAGWESLFLHHGTNRLDEGWPLYAAMRLHAGGTLYEDVLWVFPPGHVLAAWIGYGLDPPGFVLTRAIYAGFAVLLSGAVYVLGTRLMPAPFALLGALLLAVAAPRTHLMHIVFGYRYLVFAILALLAFGRWLRTGGRAWMLLSGALVGLALVFRLTPAVAVSCGIAAGMLASGRPPRTWVRDGLAFTGGLLLVAGPVVTWFGWSVGFDTLWQEVVVRPLAMLQPLPLPALFVPRFDRDEIAASFVALAFRLYGLLLAGYCVALVATWVRARRAGERFAHPLLLSVVVFGAVFFVRSQGRSDEPHLDSALPPVCLLLGHLASLAFARFAERRPLRRPALARGAVVVASLALWVFVLDIDTFLRAERLGLHPLEVLDGRIRVHSPQHAPRSGGIAPIRRGVRPRLTVGPLSDVAENAACFSYALGHPQIGAA